MLVDLHFCDQLAAKLVDESFTVYDQYMESMRNGTLAGDGVAAARDAATFVD